MSTNNNVFLNKITAVHDELYQTHDLLAALIGTLERCLKEGNDSVNLTHEICSHALQMPAFLNCSPLTKCLHNVCTRELSIEAALAEVQHYINMLKEVLDCFDETAIYNLSNHDNEKCICSDKDSEHESKCECEGECKCGGDCECYGGCECERDSEENDEEPELVSDEDFHLEISIKGSNNVLSALFL